jgi:hypothetical protein
VEFRGRGGDRREEEGVGHGLRDAILFRCAAKVAALFEEKYEAGQGAGRGFRRDGDAPASCGARAVARGRFTAGMWLDVFLFCLPELPRNSSRVRANTGLLYISRTQSYGQQGNYNHLLYCQCLNDNVKLKHHMASWNKSSLHQNCSSITIAIAYISLKLLERLCNL